MRTSALFESRNMPVPSKSRSAQISTFVAMEGDLKKFNRTIAAEKRHDPSEARDSLEMSLLRLSGHIESEHSPGLRILAKAVEALTEIAPMLAYDTDEKARTLRALHVAEALCEWSFESSLQGKITDTIELIQSMSLHEGLSRARAANVPDVMRIRP